MSAKNYIPITEDILRYNFEFDETTTKIGKECDGLINVLFFKITKDNQEWDITWGESMQKNTRCVTLYNCPFEIYYVHQLQYLLDAFGINKQIKIRKEAING